MKLFHQLRLGYNLNFKKNSPFFWNGDLAMEATVALSQIIPPPAVPPLVHRLLDDWRGLYKYCKTRRLSIDILEEDYHLLRALTDSFYAAFRDHPQVMFDEAAYRLRSSVIVQGNERSILFPYDFFIHESHANVLPRVVDRLRHSPEVEDERVFIDRLAIEFARIPIILKKNDVRIIKLLVDPAFLQKIGYLFPTEVPIARQLGITEATADMRLRRLLAVRALQLRYLAHPSAFDASLKLIRHPWPLTATLRQDSLYSFEYAPHKGISCILVPSDGVVPPEAESTTHVKTLEFSWNLTQLDQWNKPNWAVRTQLTGMRDQEVPVHTVVLDLDNPRTTRISRKDAETIGLLQETHGLGADLGETPTGVSSEQAQKAVQRLVSDQHCLVLPYFQHIGLENPIFVYYEGKPDQLADMRLNLREFPRAELMVAENNLLAVIGLPKAWCYDVQQDMEELQTEGHAIHYRVASRAAIIDPWKRAQDLWARMAK
jgi:hypothetical protein